MARSAAWNPSPSPASEQPREQPREPSRERSRSAEETAADRSAGGPAASNFEGEREPAAGGAEPPLLWAEHLRKTYRTGRRELVLFNDINFEVRRRDLLAVVGESGAGKSTLLHLMGALDSPTAGDVFFDSVPLRSLSAVQAADFRNREIG